MTQTVVSVKTTPDGQGYVVTQGLAVGDKIVTDGIATLTNGQKSKNKSKISSYKYLVTSNKSYSLNVIFRITYQ